MKQCQKIPSRRRFCWRTLFLARDLRLQASFATATVVTLSMGLGEKRPFDEAETWVKRYERSATEVSYSVALAIYSSCFKVSLQISNCHALAQISRPSTYNRFRVTGTQHDRHHVFLVFIDQSWSISYSGVGRRIFAPSKLIV